MDKILIWEGASESCYKTVSKFFPHTTHEAYVFVFKDKSAEWLELQCELLNKEQNVCEWLWSHPDADSGDNTSTHVPVLIIQDRQKLDKLRKQVGYEED